MATAADSAAAVELSSAAAAEQSELGRITKVVQDLQKSKSPRSTLSHLYSLYDIVRNVRSDVAKKLCEHPDEPIPAVINAMDRFIGVDPVSEAFQAAAVALLTDTLNSPQICHSFSHLVESAAPLVQRAVARFPANEWLQENGMQFLALNKERPHDSSGTNQQPSQHR